MVYVLDTNIFRKLLDHFPKKGKAFESVWEALDTAIVNKTVVSVDGNSTIIGCCITFV